VEQLVLAVGDPKRKAATVGGQHFDDCRQFRKHAERKLEQVCGSWGRHQPLVCIGAPVGSL
jgi:hypothetical protein